MRKGFPKWEEGSMLCGPCCHDAAALLSGRQGAIFGSKRELAGWGLQPVIPPSECECILSHLASNFYFSSLAHTILRVSLEGDSYLNMNGAAGICYLKGLHYVITHFQLGEKQAVLLPHINSSNICLYKITGTYKLSEIFPPLKIKINVLYVS